MPEGPAAFPLAICFKAPLTSLREIRSSRLVKSLTWSMRSRAIGSHGKGDCLLKSLPKWVENT
eukprot:182209-Ditylum_brightwellii.AAC.1